MKIRHIPACILSLATLLGFAGCEIIDIAVPPGAGYGPGSSYGPGYDQGYGADSAYGPGGGYGPGGAYGYGGGHGPGSGYGTPSRPPGYRPPQGGYYGGSGYPGGGSYGGSGGYYGGGPSRPPVYSRIEVLSARWQSERRTADVTDALQDLLDRGQYSFKAENQTFGADPDKGQHKRFVVRYRSRGETRTVTANEGDRVSIR